LHDTQGLVVRGYGKLHGSAFVLLRSSDVARTKKWLGNLVPQVTSGLRRARGTAVNVAFTFPGLEALGLDRRHVRGFPLEFVEGIVSPHRSLILGDVGGNRPERWDWGGSTQPEDAVHAVLLLYAVDDAAMVTLLAAQRAAWEAAGMVAMRVLDTHVLPDRQGFKEHFGFRDGVGQPTIDGGEAPRRALPSLLRRPDRPENMVASGEFVLGYPNEYGHYASSPIVATDPTGSLPRCDDESGYDLGRNGTYLVVRQLQQHVKRFWTFVRTVAGSDEAMIPLAARMIGRWPSGAPLVTSPDEDVAGLEKFNQFGYAGDPYGFACPLGAHARRANPRDAVPSSSSAAQSVTLSKRHRIIRRGRPYGPPLDPTLDPVRMLQAEDDDVERGLHFLCINADIERQFEFVQHTWLNDPKFGGLYAGPDPLMGDRVGDFHSFFIQGAPVRRRLVDLRPFVTVRGGAYFFLPGLEALRFLATAPLG